MRFLISPQPDRPREIEPFGNTVRLDYCFRAVWMQDRWRALPKHVGDALGTQIHDGGGDERKSGFGRRAACSATDTRLQGSRSFRNLLLQRRVVGQPFQADANRPASVNLGKPVSLKRLT